MKKYEGEMKVLEKQKEEALLKMESSTFEKEKLAEIYKQKILALENKVKEISNKEKIKEKVNYQLANQKNKIKDLDDEIKKMKKQKVDLFKKLKEEAHKLNYFLIVFEKKKKINN